MIVRLKRAILLGLDDYDPQAWGILPSDRIRAHLVHESDREREFLGKYERVRVRRGLVPGEYTLTPEVPW